MRSARFLLLCWAGLVSFSAVHADEERLVVHESFGSFKVRATAPMPEEVTNETQAQALARDAAIVRGQTALLTHVLAKKAHSGKKLADAEIPSIELQQHIRGYIKGARPVSTRFEKKECVVTLVLDKSELSSILRKN